MDFGLLFAFENPQPWQVSAVQLCRSMVRQAVLAEELGYDHIWTAEHHGTDDYFPAQFPLLAALATQTSRIRLGTYIVILPLYHPLHPKARRGRRFSNPRRLFWRRALTAGRSAGHGSGTPLLWRAAHHRHPRGCDSRDYTLATGSRRDPSGHVDADRRY